MSLVMASTLATQRVAGVAASVARQASHLVSHAMVVEEIGSFADIRNQPCFCFTQVFKHSCWPSMAAAMVIWKFF
jgi:hypothetical protein